MAQDKAALVKQFVDMQRPGIEALARGLVQQSERPDRRMPAREYLHTQVPAEKREAAGKAADAELKKYFDEAYPIVRDKALAAAPRGARAVLEQNFTEDELKPAHRLAQLAAEQEVPGVNPKLQQALTEKVVADMRPTIEPKLQALERQRRQGARRAEPTASAGAARRQGTGPPSATSQEVTPRGRAQRPYNFSAGPAAMPEAVLQRAAAEMLDWHGSGMGVMEMSHRGKEFGAIYAQAEADLRDACWPCPSTFTSCSCRAAGWARTPSCR